MKMFANPEILWYFRLKDYSLEQVFPQTQPRDWLVEKDQINTNF